MTDLIFEFFFHCYTVQEIYKEVITKDPTTPQTRNYLTFWRTSVLAMYIILCHYVCISYA